MITLTISAAKKITELLEAQDDDRKRLRLFIDTGGCSGFEYGMTFDLPKETDEPLESEGVSFYIDKESHEKLDGSTVDFDDGLHGKGFEVKNPNAENTCGCGKSFN